MVQHINISTMASNRTAVSYLTRSARQFVEQSFRFKKQYPDRYKKRVDYFKESLSEDINRKNECLKSKKEYRKYYL